MIRIIMYTIMNISLLELPKKEYRSKEEIAAELNTYFAKVRQEAKNAKPWNEDFIDFGQYDKVSEDVSKDMETIDF